MTITTAALLAEGTRSLALAGLECARQDALTLMAAALGVERLTVYVEPRRPVDDRAAAAYRALVERRASREPVQHILGFEEFRGLRIAVTPDVLIPRQETEGLVERALELVADRPGALVADIGTGSGAIACALAAARPDLEVLAVDQSLGALAVASDNVRALGMSSRVRLLAGDLLTLPAEVERFEPREALDGGPDGMRVLRRIITEVPRLLRPGAWLVMEIGEEQAGPLASLMAAEGFSSIGARRDLRDVERYIEGRWAEGVPSAAAAATATSTSERTGS